MTEEGRELGHGAYGMVVEVMVKGLRCAENKLHPILYWKQAVQNKPKSQADLLRNACMQYSRLRHPNIIQMMEVYFPSIRQSYPLMVMG